MISRAYVYLCAYVPVCVLRVFLLGPVCVLDRRPRVCGWQGCSRTSDHACAACYTRNLLSTAFQGVLGTPYHTLLCTPYHTLLCTPDHTLLGTPYHTLLYTPDHTLLGTPYHTLLGTPDHTLLGTPDYTLLGTPYHTLLSTVFPGLAEAQRRHHLVSDHAASQSISTHIINQNGAASGFEMCVCYPYVQDKCPIMHQRPLFHT